MHIPPPSHLFFIRRLSTYVEVQIVQEFSLTSQSRKASPSQSLSRHQKQDRKNRKSGRCSFFFDAQKNFCNPHPHTLKQTTRYLQQWIRKTLTMFSVDVVVYPTSILVIECSEESFKRTRKSTTSAKVNRESSCWWFPSSRQ